jgi:hypothetical protein
MALLQQRAEADRASFAVARWLALPGVAALALAPAACGAAPPAAEKVGDGERSNGKRAGVELEGSPPRARDAANVEWSEPFEVSRGGGYRGPWRMNESVYDYVDDPTVAVDSTGSTVVAWVDQRRKDVLLQVYGPDGQPRHPRPVNVSRSPRVFSWLPRLVVAGERASEIFVLWQEIVFSGGSHGGEIFFARSADGGASFDRPRNLSNTVAGAGKGRLDRRYWHNGSLDLARGPEGTLYAAWTEYEGPLWVSRSSDGGATFSAPLRVAGGGGAAPARGPSLAVGPQRDQVVHLVWAVGEDPAADIHLAASLDGGRSFGAPETVTSTAGHADAPKIAVDAEATLHVVWGESLEGPSQRSRVLYSRRGAESATFSEPRDLSSPQGPPGGAAFPSLSVDSEGRLFVLWELFPQRRGRPLGLGFTVSEDDGRSFARPRTVPGSTDAALGANGSQQGLLMRKLAVGKAGRVAVVNSTFRERESSNIWLWRGELVAAQHP